MTLCSPAGSRECLVGLVRRQQCTSSQVAIGRLARVVTGQAAETSSALLLELSVALDLAATWGEQLLESFWHWMWQPSE